MDVIAYQCNECKKYFHPETQGGIYVQWFGVCVDCSDDVDELVLRDRGFDCERERAIRCEVQGNTGLPRGAKIDGPSATHEEYTQRVADIWSEVVPYDGRHIQIR